MVYAGVQALSFYRPWLLPTRICHPLCHFIGHAGGQALSFYRPQLLPEQACIEAIHVACLVAQFIYVHMKPAGVSHRLMQKEARGISEAKQARGKPELGFELSWSIRNPYRNSYGNHGNPHGNPYGNPYEFPYGWHDRQQHHPYGLPYDQYILHVWGSDHRFYGNSFGLRHKHFISKGVMASRFISIEWGALTPSWVS